jgi:glycosyltransferase involved in cell wall biosynthesis
MKVAIVINTAWNIYNFRMGLMKSLRKEGFEVIAIAPEDKFAFQIKEEGFQFIPVAMDNTGSSPIRDLKLILSLCRIYRRVRPGIVLHYTIKPNTYGSIASRITGIPAINNVSGLGTVFLKKGWVSSVAMWIYRFSFQFPKLVFFQNEFDLELFKKKSLIKKTKTDVIPGSGIDLDHFRPTKKKNSGMFTFLLISRLLIDKGINEYIEAIRILKSRGIKARFQLLGGLDPDHSRGIQQEDLNMWIKEGLVDYLGTTEDVRDFIAVSDCIVLPSYREGTPRSLLEAASMGKPMIATDVPGCNNVVIDTKNGFLCKMKDSKDLADKMEMMFGLEDQDLELMGKKSREIAENTFDENIIFERYLHYIQKFIKH